MIDVHAVPVFKVILSDIEIVAVVLREYGWLGVILPVKGMGEKVIFELNNKVLRRHQCRKSEDGCQDSQISKPETPYFPKPPRPYPSLSFPTFCYSS